MPRIKTLVETAEMDIVKHAHNCQSSDRHRLSAGDKRLKVKNQRSWDHYCSDCAKKILETDIQKLQVLLQQFD